MWKGYKKILVSNGSTSGIYRIPIRDEYQNALEGDMNLNEKIIK